MGSTVPEEDTGPAAGNTRREVAVGHSPSEGPAGSKAVADHRDPEEEGRPGVGSKPAGERRGEERRRREADRAFATW